MTLEIESGVALPPKDRSEPADCSIYPYAKMAIGDSLLLYQPQNRSGGYTTYWAAKSGFKFTTRRVDAGTTRVWRVG